MANSGIKFVFFGTSDFSVQVLEVLKEKGYLPSLIVSSQDKPKGRGLELLPTPAKVWAEIHNIPVYQPKTLKDEEVYNRLKEEDADVYIVAAYGKLIPKNIFELPPHKTINVHPSLLPKLRGPSPIQSAILSEDETGMTIMLISEGMDEGPIIAQEKINLTDWPPKEKVLSDLLARKGGEMLTEILPLWIESKIAPVEQDHSQATICKKITTEDGFINLSDDPMLNLRKVRALGDHPGAYFMFTRRDGKEIRVNVKDAEIVDGVFTPTRVVPEGKREMDWQDFLRGNQ